MDHSRFKWNLSERQRALGIASLYAEWLKLHPTYYERGPLMSLGRDLRWRSIQFGVEALLQAPFDQDSMTLLFDELVSYGESELANELCRLILLTATGRLGKVGPPLEL